MKIYCEKLWCARRANLSLNEAKQQGHERLPVAIATRDAINENLRLLR